VIKRVLSSTKSMQLTWPYIGPTFAICGAVYRSACRTARSSFSLSSLAQEAS
jgi:hypothetical protein